MKLTASLLASFLCCVVGTKNTPGSTAGPSAVASADPNRLLQQEFADPNRCTTNNGTTFCPDFCGPGTERDDLLTNSSLAAE